VRRQDVANSQRLLQAHALGTDHAGYIKQRPLTEEYKTNRAPQTQWVELPQTSVAYLHAQKHILSTVSQFIIILSPRSIRS